VGPQLGEILAPVHVGLAAAEPAEVGSVEHEHAAGHGTRLPAPLIEPVEISGVRRILTIPAECREVIEPAVDQSLPLRARPSLHPLLEGERLVDAIELTCEDQLHGSPTSRMGGAFTGLVLRNATLQIPRTADVVAAVGAAEDVDERHPA